MTGTVVKFRTVSYLPNSIEEVTLEPRAYATNDWDVIYKGEFIGKVGKYQGTIDTKISGSRLVHRGVRRTLWNYATPRPANGPRAVGQGLYEYPSRAQCLRQLLMSHR